MQTSLMSHAAEPAAPMTDRAQVLFERARQLVCRHTDLMFAMLMLVQWVVAVIVAIWVSPRTWAGSQSNVHFHVWLAVLLGGVMTSFPVFLVWQQPGRLLNRYVITVAQMLFSSLLIHLMGGRLEAHFHIFGSMAFVAMYRDWKLLIPATMIVLVDHLWRGLFWPESVFGVSVVSEWRALEHGLWVLFEDFFLIHSCRNSVREMQDNARHASELESQHQVVAEHVAALEAASANNAAILTAALDAIVVIHGDGIIMEWNPQAATIFGWQRDEAIGRPLADTIVPPYQRPFLEQGLAEFRRTGASAIMNRHVDITAVCRDGREFPAEVTMIPVTVGQTTSFCAFIRDVTEPLRAKESLRKAKDAAEAADHAKSEFLANMSHEIRTPLNGILGFTDLLLGSAVVGPDDRQQYLTDIRTSSRHLLGLVNDILDLSGIETGQIEVECVPCSPHEVVAEVLSILRVQSLRKHLDLEFCWQSDAPRMIRTDPVRLTQLLMNLVGNAIKFTQTGGVRIAARLEHANDESQLVIDIIDTGIGIPAEKLEEIFEPFVQADNSVVRRFGGTGLGLAISRHIAAAMNGDIGVHSVEGRGSTFTLSVPTGSLSGVELLSPQVLQAISIAKPVPTKKLPRLSDARILLVEDGAINRKLVVAVLAEAGLNVVTAENGQIAIDIVTQNTFDLILMDMQMPVMDGYTATSLLRASGMEMPIVALTAHAIKGDEQRCLDAGCSHYLSKPIDAGLLLSTVEACLQQVLGDTDAVAALTASTPAQSPPVVQSDAPLRSTLPTDNPVFCEIVVDFLVYLDEQMMKLCTAIEQTDTDEITRLAHSIRGVAGSAGFAAFTEPTIRLEQAGHDCRFKDMQTIMAELVLLSSRIIVPSAPADVCG